jgi:RnfABCDGE-type electron transport complex B subunit
VIAPVMTAIASLGGLTLALATLLVLANRKLHVDEDPRIDVVEDLLPHANCGACGFPGCRPFAEALVEGTALPGKCTVQGDRERGRIAAFLGVDVGAEEKRVARLACAGGSNVSRRHARYDFWGCLGLGDCAEVCDFDAIHMDAHGLPVVDEASCTACGDCVEVCPKDLFSLHPISHRLWVACKSLEAGDELLEDCEVACTACGRCALDAPGLVTMRDNLAVVDYGRDHATDVPIQRCPTGAIVWMDPRGGPRKGAAAQKIIRREALRDAPT